MDTAEVVSVESQNVNVINDQNVDQAQEKLNMVVESTQEAAATAGDVVASEATIADNATDTAGDVVAADATIADNATDNAGDVVAADAMTEDNATASDVVAANVTTEDNATASDVVAADVTTEDNATAGDVVASEATIADNAGQAQDTNSVGKESFYAEATAQKEGLAKENSHIEQIVQLNVQEEEILAGESATLPTFENEL